MWTGGRGTLPSAAGPPAFEIGDGNTALQQLLSALPLGDLLVRVVAAYRYAPLTTGQAQAAVADLTRSKPFAPYAIETFLKGYAYETPKPEEEDDASHP